MQALPGGTLVAWVGDDFTGAATVMEVLEFAGLPAVLFPGIPDARTLARFPEARAIGIATTARSQTPAWMNTRLPPVFGFLHATGAPVVHYKVCSTLDSAPDVGSIGKAIDIAAPIIGGTWIPCLVAAPPMRRYQSFGHLFAAAPGGVFRLDRHPVMSRHPVTPMTESDVARHLARQTGRSFGLISVEDLESDATAAQARDRELDRGAEILSLDTMTPAHLSRCGALIWNDRQVFAVGSQGITYALVAHWRAQGLLPGSDRTAGAGAVDHILAVSGSVSPVTATQIAQAEREGFTAIPLDVAAVIRGEGSAMQTAHDAALAALSAGRDPIICSARGPDDPAVAGMRAAVAATGLGADAANGRIGTALGQLLGQLLERTGLRRAVISGGDTSGHAVQQLGLCAFTALAPTTPGAALLRAHSNRPALAGLQLALKGGQMGSPDYFSWIRRGGGLRDT